MPLPRMDNSGDPNQHFGRRLAALPQVGEFPLGNNTKCSSPNTPKNCAAAPATADFSSLEKQAKITARRAIRFTLQDAARELHMSQVPDGLGGLEALNKAHRVCKCHHTRIRNDVEIWKSTEHKKAFYNGLAICGSVWVCPVCNAKIQEKRRGEVEQAINWAYENGYSVTMITFTFPHYAFQTCKDLLDRQRDAFKYLRSGKVWQQLKEELGYEGLIRSLELNHGSNGWHPHTHEVWIHKRHGDRKLQKLFRAIHDRWFKACKKQGLVPWGKTQAFHKHATDFKANASCSDYLLKLDDQTTWGVDREITKSSAKESKKGRPPFALLGDYAKGDKRSGQLFLEYSNAVKGKSQLFWSQGLKDKVGLSDMTDEELAAVKEDNADQVCKLDMWAWMEICNRRAKSEILDIAEKRGYEGVYDWLRDHGLYDSGADTWQ